MNAKAPRSGHAGPGEAGQGTEAAKDAEARSPLGRLRLLVALDALLVEGSVGKAALRLGLGAPAMSRLLKQIREAFNDPILVKTGRGMAPTPLAETLRLRLRALAAEAEDLVEAPSPSRPTAVTQGLSNRAPLLDAPPLALARPALDGGPTPQDFARKLAAIGPRAAPRRRLAKFVALTGAGAGRTRPLTMDEADEAFSIILDGDADPIQVGALLVVMQYRGVTAAELAGLARASRRHIGAPSAGAGWADLDWPAYLSPKARFEPWFLHAARLVAQGGHRVVLHGGAGLTEAGTDRLEEAATLAGVPVAPSPGALEGALEQDGIAHLPLPAASVQLQALLSLYRLFEMRSPLNLALHLLNPAGARASLLGGAGAGSRTLFRDAAAMLGWEDVCVLSVKRDVAEAAPFRLERLQRLIGGRINEAVVAPRPAPPAEAATAMTSLEYWQAVWDGRALDEQARAVVVDTAAIALLTLRRADADQLEAARREAADLWKQRRR